MSIAAMLAPPGPRGIPSQPPLRAGKLRSRSRPSADVRRDAGCDFEAMTDASHPVLVGIDGTSSGLEAVALGSALAVLTGSRLLLGAVFGCEGEFWPPRDHAQRWLDAAAERLRDAIRWSPAALASTSPAHGLVTLAERERAGLIVLGSSRHGVVGRVVAGSTARGVVHGAPCTVAVAPHGWRIRPPEAPLTF